MDNSELKTRLTDFLGVIEAEMDSFFDGLSDDEKQKRGSLCKWSAKDVLSHLTFWGSHFNRQLVNASKGEPVPVTGDYGDQINDGVLFEHIDQPIEEAWEEYQTSFSESKSLLSDLSAEDLNNGELFEYTNGRTILDRALGTFGWHITYHLSDYFVKEGRQTEAVKLQEGYTEHLKQFPTWEANAIYNLACFYAQNGDPLKAVENLKPAFILRPDLIEWSKKDTDLDPIRGRQDFKTLFTD